MIPSEQVSRKFTESLDASDWEVWTDTGWEDVAQFHTTEPYEIWQVHIEGGYFIEAADTHILFDENFNEIFVKDLVAGTLVITDSGAKTVLSVKNTRASEEMFDLSVDSTNHRFYGNGVLSHNSSSIAAAVVHFVIFNEAKEVAILANKAATAREILSRVQFAYESLPLWLQQGVVEWNKGSLELENKCKVFAAASTASSIRGRSLAMLLVDEAAFLTGWDTFWGAVYPTISSGKETKVVLLSTPMGLNHFYGLWEDAVAGINGFHPIKVTWKDNPDRNTPEWEAKQRAILGDERFETEHECAFQGSTHTLIKPSKIKEFKAKNPLKSLENHNLKVYIDQIKSTDQFILIADVAHGKGLDYSAFSIVDISTQPYQQVATFRNNKIEPLEYGEVIHRTATKFNNALVLIELNDMGSQVAKAVKHDLEYEGVLHTVNLGRKGQVPCYWDAKGDPGVKTSKTTKAVGCNMLKYLIEGNMLLIHDKDTISELSTFIRSEKSTDSYCAQDGSHDDTVMPLVLFGWLANSKFFTDITNMEVRKQLMEDSESFVESMSSPVFHIIRLEADIEGPVRIEGDDDVWFMADPSEHTNMDPSDTFIGSGW